MNEEGAPDRAWMKKGRTPQEEAVTAAQEEYRDTA